jgi:cyclophilin family peptidyl-prolyl cis-trans isomerase
MKTRYLALTAALVIPTAARAVDVEMKIDVAGAERTVVIRLDEKIAPKTSANFAKLCGEGFYDGIAFHRVISNYIVQTGDPLSKDPAQIEKWGTGGPGYTIPAELGGSHVRGAVAAARLGDQANPEKASSGSQFYVALRDIKPLDGKYTVFGNVISGLEAFDEIAGAPTNEDNVPTAPIAIISTRVLVDEPEPKKPAMPALTATEPAKPAPAEGKPAAVAPSAVAAVETPQAPAVAMEKPAAPAIAKPLALAEPDPKPAPAPAAEPAMEKPTAPAPNAASPLAAVEPDKKEAPAIAKPLALAEPDPKPAPAPAAEPAMEKPAPAPLALGGELATADTSKPSAIGSSPAPAPEPAMAKQPAFSALTLNDAPAISTDPIPVAPAPPTTPPPSVADALAAAMRNTPAPEIGAPAAAATSSTGFNFGEPVRREPATASPDNEDRMPLNPDRGLPAVRLNADDDTLARATAALGLPGGAGATDPDDGFMPLSSVGNLSAAPAPAAKPGRLLPDPPMADQEPDPLAAPGFSQSPGEPSPPSRLQQRFHTPASPPGSAAPAPSADRPTFATSPEPGVGAAESDPLAPAPSADPAAGPGEAPAGPPAAARAPEPPPRGFLGKFIRRVW